MKSTLIFIIVLVISSIARADVVTLSTEGTTVEFTNSQNNFVWSPTALIYSRNDSVSITLTIHRYGNGQPVLLSSISATASNLIWAPQARYIFTKGSSLVLTSSVANFSVQLHREPAHD